MKNTLKLKLFGNGLIYYRSTFDIEWWEGMLNKNRMKQDAFLNNLFTDDVFLQKTIIHPKTGLSCCNYREFLGKPIFKGASVKEHGFMEIKQNTKNVFKGTIQTICMDNLLFPLFNSLSTPINEKQHKGITITAAISIKGLVGSYATSIDEFRNDKLEFQLIEVDNNKVTGTYIELIKYDDFNMKIQPFDYLITSQRYWCEII